MKKTRFIFVFLAISMILSPVSSYADFTNAFTKTPKFDLGKPERDHDDWDVHYRSTMDTIDNKITFVGDTVTVDSSAITDTPTDDEIVIDSSPNHYHMYIYDTPPGKWRLAIWGDSDAQTLDGYNTGNDTGDICPSNGGRCIGLFSDTAFNAELLDNKEGDSFVEISGDSLTGRIQIPEPLNRSDAATKNYVDSQQSDSNIGVYDNGTFIGDFPNINFGETLTVTIQNGDTALVESKGIKTGGGGGGATSFNDTGYIEPDGLVIDTGGASDSVSVSVGGAVDVSHVSGDTSHQIVNVPAGDTADLSESGCNGLIKGSLTTNAWYKGYVLADNDGNNPPCIAWVQEGNTLTFSDLPSGYELRRNMAGPGKTWWVKTDGSSNIHQFNHFSNGKLRWTTTTRNNFSQLLQTSTAQTSWSSVDVSEQVPPTSCQVGFTRLGADDSGGGTRVEFSSDDNTNASSVGDVTIDLGGNNTPLMTAPELTGVQNQEIFWVVTGNSSNFSSAFINRVKEFKAVN